jgi:hypothetical protein
MKSQTRSRTSTNSTQNSVTSSFTRPSLTSTRNSRSRWVSGTTPLFTRRARESYSFRLNCTEPLNTMHSSRRSWDFDPSPLSTSFRFIIIGKCNNSPRRNSSRRNTNSQKPALIKRQRKVRRKLSENSSPVRRALKGTQP